MGAESVIMKQQAKIRELNIRVRELEYTIVEWERRYTENLTGTPDEILLHIKHRLSLTQSESLLLVTLLRRPQGHRKEALHESIYAMTPGDTPELKIIDVFVCKIRKKLRDHGLGDCIDTIWGAGYRINEEQRPALVEALGYDPAEAPAP